jgi:hypothetical protein
MLNNYQIDSNIVRLRAGHRVKINAGKYNGKNGTIIKINNVRHQVKVDTIGLGWVTRTFCTLILEPKETSPRHKVNNRNPSRPLHHSPTANRPPLVIVPDTSDTSTTGSTSVESRHGPKVTMQVLLDLLANLIATMHIGDTMPISDDQIDEWTRQLRPRIIHFRHNSD